jgi:putative two-component system response regulator
VADVFDALSSKRVYKPAFPLEKCFRIMQDARGSQFDPTVLDAFFRRKSDIVDVQIQYADTD